MVIFLYGPDVHRLKKESDSVVSKYKEKHPNGFNFFSISLQDDGLKKLEDTIKTVSFFEEIKLILLRGVTANKVNAEALGELIKEQDLIKNKAIVLLVSENLSEKDFKEALTGDDTKEGLSAIIYLKMPSTNPNHEIATNHPTITIDSENRP